MSKSDAFDMYDTLVNTFNASLKDDTIPTQKQERTRIFSQGILFIEKEHGVFVSKLQKELRKLDPTSMKSLKKSLQMDPGSSAGEVADSLLKFFQSYTETLADAKGVRLDKSRYQKVSQALGPLFMMIHGDDADIMLSKYRVFDNKKVIKLIGSHGVPVLKYVVYLIVTLGSAGVAYGPFLLQLANHVSAFCDNFTDAILFSIAPSSSPLSLASKYVLKNTMQWSACVDTLKASCMYFTWWDLRVRKGVAWMILLSLQKICKYMFPLIDGRETINKQIGGRHGYVDELEKLVNNRKDIDGLRKRALKKQLRDAAEWGLENMNVETPSERGYVGNVWGHRMYRDIGHRALRGGVQMDYGRLFRMALS